MDRLREVFVNLEEENKRKDEYIKEIEKKIETLDVEKDLLEQRNEYLHEKIKKNDSFITKILNIQSHLNEVTLSIDTTSIRRM